MGKELNGRPWYVTCAELSLISDSILTACLPCHVL